MSTDTHIQTEHMAAPACRTSRAELTAALQHLRHRRAHAVGFIRREQLCAEMSTIEALLAEMEA